MILVVDEFIERAAERQAAYRELRRAWAEEIGRPIPKRKRKGTHPDPGTIDAAADEVD